MNDFLDQMMGKMPPSPTQLKKRTIKKIHRVIPVPNEYEILWADITSLKGYPSGIVITDKAFILKASKIETKKMKRIIKKENKKKDKANRIKPPKVFYQIIPWEYFNPEEFEIKLDESKEAYILFMGDREVARFAEKGLHDFLVSYKQSVLETQLKVEETFSAMNSFLFKNTMFSATYGIANSTTGHGIYAEEYGVRLDRLHFSEASVTGRDNAKNGPDKIVNSIEIQCKYYKDAKGSIDACFKKNPSTGVKEFRYLKLDNKAMQIEVPSDQYIDAIEIMKDKIRNGQVKGVTNPDEAYSIVRKGRLTYQQVRNIAKAGTIQSLKYDAITGAINCASVFGISAVISFAQILWVTKDYKKAAKSAIMTALQVSSLSFVGGIVAAQLSRTSLTSAINPLASSVSDALGPDATKEIINGCRTIAGKKPIYGAAAQKSFTKFLGATVITQAIMIVAFSIPDIYRLTTKKISASQFFKNVSTTFVSFLFSIGASIGTGIFISRKFGEKANNTVVKVVAMGVGCVAGAIGGFVTKVVFNCFREDDFIVSYRLFNALLQNQIIEHLLSSDEQDELMKQIDEDEKVLKVFLQTLRRSKNQEQDIVNYLDNKIEKIIEKRNRIDNMDEKRMDNSIGSVLLEGELAYEV